jgi:hypothetical protein
MRVLHFLRKHCPVLVFRYQLNAVITRCATKYPYNNTKSTCIVYRWIQRYVNKEEGNEGRTIVKVAWSTGKLVKDTQKEIS